MSDRTQKLVALRARTDHDLLILVHRELDRGMALVAVAATRTSPHFAQAEKAFATGRALFLRISGLTSDDRVRIEARLKDLRTRLDQVPAFAKVRAYPASFAS